ncbi:hypothetical protein V6N13_061519 [Hibiscus sabdariffa]|uniref:Uncharacterized protein n=1 Tax=Hibiscus sabdariffa TaxID=183260 RepID=A0ABR2BEC2_9ROSI
MCTQGSGEGAWRTHSSDSRFKHTTIALEHTEEQGNRCTPNRCNQGCQCTGRAKGPVSPGVGQQDRGASPM